MNFFKLPKKQCVEHIVEGRQEWQKTLSGKIVLTKYWLQAALLTLITMGTPWWAMGINDEEVIRLKVLVFICCILFALLLFLGIRYLRKRSIRSLRIKFLLHNLSHYLRDHHRELEEADKNGTIKNLINKEFMINFMNNLCNRLQPYFDQLMNDRTINVAIRLAVESKKRKIVYRTFGRSVGLSEERKETSEDIELEEGIPLFFLKHRCKGLLRYNDIIEAAKFNLFKITESEKRFPTEIVNFIVAPLNSWDGSNNSMIGLLYVTSQSKHTLHGKHADSIKFLADMISPLISITNQKIKILNSKRKK